MFTEVADLEPEIVVSIRAGTSAWFGCVHSLSISAALVINRIERGAPRNDEII